MTERESDWLEGNDARTQQERQREMGDTRTPPQPSPGWRGSAYSHPFAADLAAERDALAARLAAVEALHYPEAKHGTWCEQDKEHWPCATILALNASSSEAPAS